MGGGKERARFDAGERFPNRLTKVRGEKIRNYLRDALREWRHKHAALRGCPESHVAAQACGILSRIAPANRSSSDWSS